jgi:tetratricopeptide (TPR) repeat protein
MRYVTLNGWVAGLLVVAVMGCQALQRSPSDPMERSGQAGPSAPAYYYFSAAQVKLKQGDINEALWYMEKALGYDPTSAYLRLELANLLLIKKDNEGALEQVNRILEHQPEHVQALTVAGRIHQQRNELAAAKACFEKVLALKSDEQPIYLLLGRIYWDEGDLDNTARVFAQMVAHFPDFYASHYFYGKVLVAKGALVQAEKELLESLVLEPTLEESRAELLKIYKIQNKSAKITQLYGDLLENNPDNHMATLGLAEHYHQLGNEGPAKQLLFDLGRKAAGDNQIVAAVFETYLETKRFDTALWILSAMLPAAPDNSELNYLAALAADGLERDEVALQYLAKVAPRSKFYGDAVVQTAIIHHNRGQIDEAIGVVRQALGHEPDNSDYYLYLGSFYEELERYEDALKILQQGVAVDDKNKRLHFRMGVIYDRMGQKEASIKAMRRVLQLAPNDAEALNYLGYTFADMGINLDEAEMLVQAALKIKPDDGYITDSLGWIYYKQGHYSEALRWLTKAVSLVPDDPTILEHLGDLHLKMDRKQKALNFYQRSLDKKDKDRDSLKDKIRSLTPE